MSHFRYIGTDPLLKGQTALGRIIGGYFCVQVDNLNHPFGRGWHTHMLEEWERIK